VSCYFVIPVFNGESTLGRAVESVLRQRGINQHVSIVDHASSDGSPELGRDLAASVDRVIFVSVPRLPHDRHSPGRPLDAFRQSRMESQLIFSEAPWLALWKELARVSAGGNRPGPR
jgi:glycosyltransferase involved in cell wall biosynthesis